MDCEGVGFGEVPQNCAQCCVLALACCYHSFSCVIRELCVETALSTNEHTQYILRHNSTEPPPCTPLTPSRSM